MKKLLKKNIGEIDTWGQANSTGMPHNQKSKQRGVTNPSLYEHCSCPAPANFLFDV